VTHPRVFGDPTPLGLALQFAVSLRNHPNAVTLAPGERHWNIFQRLCQEVNAKGNLIADAYLAALAIETGAEWITTDRVFRPTLEASLDLIRYSNVGKGCGCR